MWFFFNFFLLLCLWGTFSGDRQGFSLFKQEKWQCNICHFPLHITQKEGSVDGALQRCNYHFLSACPPNHTFKTHKEKWDLQITTVSILWCFFSRFPLQPCCESPHLFLLGTRYTGETVSHSDVRSGKMRLLISNPTLLRWHFGSHPQLGPTVI